VGEGSQGRGEREAEGGKGREKEGMGIKRAEVREAKRREEE